MATHSCLLVSCRRTRRSSWLYTCHSGYAVPSIVLEAPQVLGKYRRSYIATQSDAEDNLNYDSTPVDWLSDIDCVVALLIAARPCVLTPINASDRACLPTWAGNKDPYRLIIRYTAWTLCYPKYEKLEPVSIDARLSYVESFPKTRRRKSDAL